MRHRVVAAITLSVGRVTKEDTWNGTRSEFMGGGGCGVGVARATKNTETVIGGRSAIEEMMRRVVPAWPAWPEVEEEGGGGEGIGPKPRRHVGMKKKGAHTLIEGA